MALRRLSAILLISALALPVAAGGNRESEAREPDPAETVPDTKGPADSESDPMALDEWTSEILFSLGISPFDNRVPSENFVLANLSGVEEALVDYRGRVVFLNFWATWCPPCREEMPSMQALYDELGADGLEILAVNVLEPPETVAPFIEEFGFTYPVLLDDKGVVSTQYSVRAFPTTYILDREGNVIGFRAGFHDWASEGMIEGFRQLLEL